MIFVGDTGKIRQYQFGVRKRRRKKLITKLISGMLLGVDFFEKLTTFTMSAISELPLRWEFIILFTPTQVSLTWILGELNFFTINYRKIIITHAWSFEFFQSWTLEGKIEQKWNWILFISSKYEVPPSFWIRHLCNF